MLIVENTIIVMHDVNAGAMKLVTGMNPALCRLNPKIDGLVKSQQFNKIVIPKAGI